MSKLEGLVAWFEGRRALIALSGGVDSALVAYAAYQKLGDNAAAITADYKTLSHDELDSAKAICSQIGIRHIMIRYDELQNENYVRNDSERCFYCRGELARHLNMAAEREGADTIVDGANLGDLGDHRPGMRAMRLGQIRSPLIETGFTKKDVREAAREAGLAVSERPSNSCLASRIPWGTRVTASGLWRIEQGEAIIKDITGARQVRLRDMDNTARIEVWKSEIGLVAKKMDALRVRLGQIGFGAVELDMDGYAPGKINVMTD